MGSDIMEFDIAWDIWRKLPLNTGSGGSLEGEISNRDVGGGLTGKSQAYRDSVYSSNDDSRETYIGAIYRFNLFSCRLNQFHISKSYRKAQKDEEKDGLKDNWRTAVDIMREGAILRITSASRNKGPLTSLFNAKGRYVLEEGLMFDKAMHRWYFNVIDLNNDGVIVGKVEALNISALRSSKEIKSDCRLLGFKFSLVACRRYNSNT